MVDSDKWKFVRNMYKKFVASFMTALMAAMTLVSPVMGATALKDYPTALGKVGDFYVVVGKEAMASDVAGAIDIAANLAQLSYKDTAISGTTTTSAGLTGTERKVTIPASSTAGAIGGTTANTFPVQLKNFHYTGLKEGQYEYRGTKQNYHEEIVLSTTDPVFKLTHSISSPVNGTLKMRVEGNATTYRYLFDSTISSADFSATSANSTTYSTPLKVMIAGKEFQIVAVPSTTSFSGLVGTVKTLSDGESLTVGDLTFTVTQSFSSSTAKIKITDASGNEVKSSINTGSTESVSSGGSTYNYRVLSSGATASGVPGFAQLLAGKGDIEKTMDGSDTATVSEWGTDWRISGTFQTAGRVQSGDHIDVRYAPASLTDTNRYFLAGSTFKGPGGYFEFKFAGLTPDKFAKVTITPVTGITVYNTTGASGYSTSENGGASSLNGLKISSDVAGTIVNGSTGYDEVYVLFNGSSSTTNWLDVGATTTRAGWWLAYKDKATGRVVNADQTGAADQWPSLLTTSGNFSLTLSYGGPGATSTFTLGGLFHNQTLLSNVMINSTSGVEVTMAFQNKSAASTSSPPELRLGTTTASADSNDVQVRIEGTAQQDVATQDGTVLTDGGIQTYTVKSNVQSDKVVTGIPPETIFGLVQFGKIGEASTTTTSGGTVKEVVAITAAVAKLDNEVSSTDKTGKHLVLVGGPCKNSLVADLKTAGKLTHGCSDWPGRNFAIVQVVDDAFASGKKAVVVAGTRAEDTRLASSVLQAYATKLSSITAGKVEVTGTVLESATITTS